MKFLNDLFIQMGFLCGSRKNTHLPMQEIQVKSLGPEDSLEKEITTHSSILAWKIQGQGSLGATVHGVAKESDTT